MPHTRSQTAFDPSQKGAIENLQIVFKVVERCNLNCAYCYYFNMGDATALGRPAIVPLTVAQDLARWLAEGCRELDIGHVKIAFHGGEPMLLRPDHFDQICQTLQENLGKVVDLSFGIQTNGTILNEKWLRLFDRHAVRVGVSIDGDRLAQNRYRLDHAGRSSFQTVENNLNRLVQWADGDRWRIPGTITVLDHRNDYKRIYNYLRTLGIYWMNFLLPDRSADDTNFDQAASYGRAMLDIFEAWLSEDNPEVDIKFCRKVLSYFQVYAPVQTSTGMITPLAPPPRKRKEYQVLIVRSDGTVAVDDSFMPATGWYDAAPVAAISDTSLGAFLRKPIFREIEAEAKALPDVCRPCPWRRACRGGDLENRFSAAKGFNNPSVYCDSYQLFYQGISELLVANGYPSQFLEDRFGAVLAPSHRLAPGQ